MAYYADYKIVDGMYFVKGTGPKGTVVSYGKTSVTALTNLMNKYGWQFKERVLFRLGNMTEAPIDNEVTVRHNKCNDWWFKHRERKATNCPAKPADEDDKDSEYVYEVEDGVLKVYRVTLEKVYKIRQPKAEPKSSDFLAGLAEGVRINNGVEDAS